MVIVGVRVTDKVGREQTSPGMWYGSRPTFLRVEALWMIVSRPMTFLHTAFRKSGREQAEGG